MVLAFAEAFGQTQKSRKSTFYSSGSALFMFYALPREHFFLSQEASKQSSFILFTALVQVTEDLHDLFLEEIKLGKSSGNKCSRVRSSSPSSACQCTKEIGSLIINLHQGYGNRKWVFLCSM